ncbi:MAG TPA: ion channel [Gammaproteobacteria bacterium]|nr:ion channel [Gammaproteobacteria bacterium]
MINLAIGLFIMLVCLLLQALLFAVVIRYYMRRRILLTHRGFLEGFLVVAGILLLLVTGILAQIAIWAFSFVLLGEFSVFSESFYHSAVNFATLGYGDLVMSDEHKLLGPLEAVNGVLMVGISTATLMLAFQDVVKISFVSRQSRAGQEQ